MGYKKGIVFSVPHFLMSTPPPVLYEQVPQATVPIPSAQPLVYPQLPPQPDLHPRPEVQSQPPYQPQQEAAPSQPVVMQPVMVSSSSNPPAGSSSGDVGYS